MNPLYGKALLFLGLLLTIVIRIPHDKKSSVTKVLKDRKTSLEKALLGGVAVGVMIQLVTTGVYGKIRHSMYSAIFLYG
jgi:protein-S-isoprenylcysteine O-methyltransferase Ste14